ncbi:pentatricopeptide repeat-containing protein At2g18520, mitochondrial [Aegilops tauschii subsp. strangulata]|uniref:Pentacotripeptide-repeat region of PRORP domain-containing protein n=2 Tax=Aegilops tauschii TaxID=37682 RepID=A0A453P4Y6_AEGTS|nr:pentatricopeptide repeat-containing protein At4g36680, mitochondrial [Aegilops tauschii subsp. strangulata]
MAALASLLRRRSSLRADVLLRTLCATATAPPLTSSAAKTRLRREYDADRAVSLLEAIDTASLSAGSTRHALSLAARRLTRAGRHADAEALLSSHIPASPTEPHLSAILCSYASAGLPEKALEAFRSAAPSLPSPISPMPFNALLSAFVRCRRHLRVPVLFEELSKEFSITPNAISYAILVKAHCMVRHDAKAHEVIARMREEGISPTTTIYTTMIDSMYKQKKVEEARTLWKQMLESGCKPDHATYNVKAMHHGLNGKPEGVLQVMAEMEADGVKPDTITYNFLMTAYCKDGKMEDAKALYRSLGDKGCSANAATYKHMLAALFAHGDFDTALEIFRESMSKHKVPDFKTMKGFVEGLAKGGRVAEAKEVIYVVMKKFPDTMLSGWKKLEKELGFCSDNGDTTPHAECTAEEPVSEAEPATTEALELKDSAAEETGVSEESDDDETPSPETSTDEEVPRGPA